MRKIALAATAAVIALSSSAYAGGMYVGISAGHDFNSVEGVDTTLIGGNPAAYDYNADGGTLGMLAGFNYMHDNMVFGIEGDINWADGDDSQDGIVAILTYEHSTEINWTAAARARLGIVHGNNIVYIAGGYAVADVDHSFGFSGNPTPFHTYSETRTGWTLGGGIDHAFDETLSGRIEYRYSDYGEVTNSDVPDNSRDTNELTTHGIRGALIMKF